MAKSTVKTFVYKKANGEISTRKVFVMNETSEYIRGIDFGYLSDDEQKKVLKNLANHEVSGVISFKRDTVAKPIEGFDESWKDCFRLFKKSNIQ